MNQRIHAQAHTSASTPRSQLADWQKWITFSAVLLASVMAAGLWNRSPAWALFVGWLMLLSHAPVLALELVLVSWTYIENKVPKPTWMQLVGAWWQEVCLVPLVFAWRQPFRWRCLPDTLREENAQCSDPLCPAVVFVHGFVCNRGFWQPWMQELRLRGIPYLAMNLEPVLSDIDALVPQLERSIQHAEKAAHKKPVLICHSMGGLVARAWLAAAPGNAERVQHIVTLGTPHHGTWLARLSHTESGRQMRMGSAWLMELQKKEAAVYSADTAQKFTCWYSNTDNIVFPAAVATLDGADNRLLLGSAHVALAFHPSVMRESLEMLASASSSPMARTAS